VVTILGLVGDGDVLGFIPVNTPDHFLHAAISSLGIITGLMSRGRDHDHDHDRGGTTRTATTGHVTGGRDNSGTLDGRRERIEPKDLRR